MHRLSFKSLTLGGALVSVALGPTQLVFLVCANVALLVSDQAFALANSAVLSVLGYVPFTPNKVLAAQLCPPGVHDTAFGALMGVYNPSSAASGELRALLTTWLGVTEKNLDNL